MPEPVKYRILYQGYSNKGEDIDSIDLDDKMYAQVILLVPLKKLIKINKCNLDFKRR